MTRRRRTVVTLRSPAAGAVELVITTDGVSVVHVLSLDQVKLLALESVRALVSWPEVAS
jgi:hypothetical protein